jgi:two-component system, cell cycle sensor histidine kinase and response regulator CckA
VNQAAVALFGREREELLGESLGFSIPDGSPAEITVLRKGGDRVAEIRVSRLTWHDEVAHLAICRDITESKRVTMQLQVADRMASLGTLAAGVAHEINNPLATVLANLTLVREQLETLRTQIHDDVLEELSDAMVAGERVRRIVRDLKVLSRVEDDERGPVDVERVLDWTLRMAQNEIRHRAHTVRDYRNVPPILANEPRLAQVFLNLVVNAAQSIPEGNAEQNEIRVSTELDAGRVVVAISDTGQGMAPEVQARLFTPFFTTKPVGDGTGLGLAICHRIIEGLGGDITFESRRGRGTMFRVALPVAAPVEAPVLASPQPAPPRRRGRVLVIDDEVAVAKVVLRMLSREHEVVTENRGADALARLHAGERFDVILCDLIMPDLTGMDLYEALLRDFPDDAARMVFLSGGAFTPRSRAFLDTVPNQRLEKPFDLAALRVLVNMLVG